MKALKNINRKTQAGMTLTESLLVLSVGALVAVLAYGGYKMATDDVKSQSQAKATVQLVGKIKQTFGTAPNYNDVTVNNVVNARLVPADFKTTATPTIVNAWGGNVTPAVVTGNTAQFQLTITSVPSDGCVEFLSGISSAALSLTMGTGASNAVKAAGGQFNTANAATQCNAGGDIVLVAQ